MSMLLSLIAAAATSVATEPRTPPAPNCLDSRTVELARQLTPRMLLATGPQGKFRIDLAEQCPLSAGGDITMLARQGWVCGEDNEFVRIDGRVCAVAAVGRVDAREYAQLQREADQVAQTVRLETIEIEARVPKHRRFASSTEYCVAEREVRGWDSDGDAMVVTVSPFRQGGHRQYRIELGRSCPELSMARQMVLQSGTSTGWVCGNAGDVARIVPDVPAELGFEQPSTFGLLATSMGCPIVAVYPTD